MILKIPPQVFYSGKEALTKVIGSPEDYVKNRASGNFPDSTDLHIQM